MNPRLLEQTDDDISRIKALQKELKQLKELLIKKDLDKLIDDSYLTVAAKKLGYKDVLELKKTKHQALMETIENNPKERPFSIATICQGYFLSRDAFYKYKKRFVKRIKIENQVWAADITYIRTIKGFCYLALLTDIHSRIIVGFDLSDSLTNGLY